MDELLSWEEISGRNDPRQRFRIYRLHPRDTDPELVATCADETGLGYALTNLAREGELVDHAIGIIEVVWDEDEMVIKGSHWLVKPWLPGPATVPEAGRILRIAESEELGVPKAIDCYHCGQRVRLTEDSRLFKHRLGIGFTPDEVCEASGKKVEFKV